MNRTFLIQVAAAVAFTSLTACGDDAMTIPDGGTADTGTRDSGRDAEPAGAEPEIASILVAESANSALIYSVSFTTDTAAQGRVEVVPTDGEAWEVPVSTEAETEHELTVLGLRAETEYRFRIHAEVEGGGASVFETDAVTTAALPDDFPPLSIEVLDAPAATAGVRLFGIRRWTPSQDQEWGYFLAIDEEGEVVWYLDVGRPTGDLGMRSNGNLLFEYGNSAASEITIAGDVLWDRPASEIGTDSIHHEVFPLDNGNILALSSELRTIAGYPGDETFDVVGDTVVVLSEDGSALLTEHSLFDILDPMRVRDGFHNPFWNTHYAEDSEGTKDWTHGNAVIVDDDGHYILCLRHQDWLIKMNAETGELIWRFGEEGDFTMAGEGEFAFHPHAPELQEDGTLLVYDNGNVRSTLGEGELPYTRVVLYDLDEEGMTATELWEYAGQSPYFAPFVGDADRLPTGNVLITDGGLLVGCPSSDNGSACAIGSPDTQKWARIVEVTEAGAEVMRITIRDDAEVNPTGYTVYRAEHLTSLYGAAR